jgi:hypothetical protein
VTDTNRTGKLSRRDAVALFAGGPALGVDAALASVFGGTAGASLLFADGASACTPPPLAQLAPEHFEPLVGSEFTVGEHRVTLRAVRRGPALPAQFREQFAVTFDAPRAPSVASAPVRVAHPAIGRHDLLVTDVNQGADRALEICFA